MCVKEAQYWARTVGGLRCLLIGAGAALRVHEPTTFVTGCFVVALACYVPRKLDVATLKVLKLPNGIGQQLVPTLRDVRHVRHGVI